MSPRHWQATCKIEYDHFFADGLMVQRIFVDRQRRRSVQAIEAGWIDILAMEIE